MKLITCNANRPLAEAIGEYLGLDLTDAEVLSFRDREVFVRINENVRGHDVFVLQSTSAPANDHLMELLIMIDTLVRASARRITAVIPYFGYARQDRKTGGRTPISAKLVANLVSVAGANRVLTVDLHAGQIQGFFDIPTDNLSALREIEHDIRSANGNKRGIVVSPDVGGVVRARILAKRLEWELAIVDKRRPRAGETEVMNIIGDVTDRPCVIVDDMSDSAGTLVGAARALRQAGAGKICSYVTHGVLSGDAGALIEASNLDELVVTDTIDQKQHLASSAKIRVVTIAPLIAEAIRRTSNEESVSKLFDPIP